MPFKFLFGIDGIIYLPTDKKGSNQCKESDNNTPIINAKRLTMIKEVLAYLNIAREEMKNIMASYYQAKRHYYPRQTTQICHDGKQSFRRKQFFCWSIIYHILSKVSYNSSFTIIHENML